jgi:hypothetical protein
MQIDVPALFSLWNDKSLEVREIAHRLDCSTTLVFKEAARRGLPHRGRVGPPKSFFNDDPSPEQIAEYERRKVEVREKHFSDMRSKP